MYGTSFIISPRASRVNMPRRGKVFRIRVRFPESPPGYGFRWIEGEKTGPDLHIRPVPFSAAAGTGDAQGLSSPHSAQYCP